MKRWFRDIWFSIKKFIIRKYYLKITTLDYGYACGDDVILHGMFQVLTRFVEKESHIIEWYECAKDTKKWVEIQYLYHWWTVIRPSRVSVLDTIESPKLIWVPITEGKSKGCFSLDWEFNGINHKKAWKEKAKIYTKQEEDWYTEDDVMMKRLIEVRPSLWT